MSACVGLKSLFLLENGNVGLNNLIQDSRTEVTSAMMYLAASGKPQDNHDSSRSRRTDHVRLWCAQTLQQVGTIDTTTTHKRDSYYIGILLINPDNTILAAACRGIIKRSIKLWDLSSQLEIITFTTDAGVRSMCFDHCSENLVALCNSCAISVWSLESQQRILSFDVFMYLGRSADVFYCLNSERLICSNCEESIDEGSPIFMGVFDARTGADRGRIYEAVGVLVVSPKGDSAATVGRDDSIQLWNLITLEKGVELTGQAGPTLLSFDETGDRLVSVGINIMIWNLISGMGVMTITCTSWHGMSIFLTADYVIQAATAILIYDATSGELVTTINDIDDCCVCCSPRASVILM
jgi:WD40 repeat protein